MAATSYAAGHPLAVSIWAKKLSVEALRQTYFYEFLGRGSGYMIQYRDELGKNAGDRVTFGLRGQLTGAGIQGDGTLENNEEALNVYADTLIIDQLRHAVRSAGKMSEQRVSFEVREEAKDGLRDWWADRLDTCLFNQLCGFTAQTDTRYTGNNAAIAPDSSHIFRPNSRTTDQSLTTGDEFNLAIIDTMVARANQFNMAASSGVPMKPLTGPNGRKMWVMFLHDNQVYQLRQSSTAAGSWVDYERAKVQGGNMNSPIYKGGDLVGEYNGVVLHRAPRVTNGVHSTTGAAVANARRAVLVGAQAAMFATGRDDDVGQQDKFSWVEERFDYNNQLGVSAGSIFGLKKTRFNSQDFATFVAATYSPNP
jgi:N4-gp56 family major capsid protein